MKINILMISAFLFSIGLAMVLISCKPKPEPKPKRVDSIHCIHKCVDYMLYDIEEIGGTVVSDMRKLCEDKFKAVNCCKTATGYYKECK